jgi:hypothetical protein
MCLVRLWMQGSMWFEEVRCYRPQSFYNRPYYYRYNKDIRKWEIE